MAGAFATLCTVEAAGPAEAQRGACNVVSSFLGEAARLLRILNRSKVFYFPGKSLLSENLSYSQLPSELPFSMLRGSCPTVCHTESWIQGPHCWWCCSLSEPTRHTGGSLSTSLPC